MLFRILPLFFAINLVFGLMLPAGATLLAAGKPAPPFLVESGDGQRLSLEMLKGKVVVLFHESRQVIGKNRRLKDELTDLYHAQPEAVQNYIFRLVVIDCSEASVLTRPIWNNQLRENSRKQGFTIYGDWNRNMLTNYSMKRNESNFYVIDQLGIIRYALSGKIDNRRVEEIKSLLLTLVQMG